MIFWKFQHESKANLLHLQQSFALFFFILVGQSYWERSIGWDALAHENYSSKNPEKKSFKSPAETTAISMVFWIMFHLAAFILCWLTTKLLSLFITFICNGDDIPFRSVVGPFYFCIPFSCAAQVVPIHIFRFKWFFVAHFNYLHFITIF